MCGDVRPDARAGSRPAGGAAHPGLRRPARGAGALHRDRRAAGARGSRRVPLSRAARRLAAVRRRFPSPGGPGRSSRRRAATARRSPSRPSSAATCWSSCARWSTSSAPRSRSARATQEIPYPFVTDAGDEFIHRDLSVAELARFFPTPMLANVGDEIADGTFRLEEGKPRPLALFDAVRVDYSLRRLRALHRHRLAHDPAVDPVHQLPALRRPVRRAGRWPSWPSPTAPMPAWRCRAARWSSAAPTAAMRGAGRGGAVASLPDAGLQPDARRRQGRRHHRQYRRRPLERQDRRPTISPCCARTAG